MAVRSVMEDDAPGCLYNFTQRHGETVEVPTFRFYFDLEHGTSNNHPESSSSGQCFGYLLP